MDADTASILTNIYGSVGEDACPMTVWPAAFLVKDIGQSNEHPCGLNTITVTLATNVPLLSSITEITISRIKGGIQDDLNVLEVTLKSQTQKDQCSDSTGSSVEVFDRHGSWYQSQDTAEATLTLHMASSGVECCVPGATNRMFIFAFDVYNPSIPQVPTHPVSISATGIPIQVSAMRHDVGRLSPMYVKQGELQIKTIWQSSHYPCADNTVTVTLQLNVNLYKRCNAKITVTGLSNVTLSDGTVPWVDSSRVGAGTWDGGVLIISAPQDDVSTVHSMHSMSFAFTMKNPLEAVAPLFDHTIAIQEIGLQKTKLTVSPITNLVPITVIAPAFTTASIVQSNPYPAGTNIISITLESNVDLPEACKVQITIAGLVGACVESTESTLALEGSDSGKFRLSLTDAAVKGTWNIDAKSVTFYTAGADLTAGEKVSFQFTVRNPTTGQASPKITIESSGIVIPRRIMDKNPDSMVPPNVFFGLAKEAEPMEIRGAVVAAAFVTKKIGQSSAVAGAPNTITVTLQTNVPLTLSSPQTTVTIKSLAGALGPDSGIPLPFEVVEKPSSGGSFTGAWKAAEKALVLTVSGEDTVPGEDYEIEFSITNPRATQSSPTIMIEASGIVIQPVAMTSPDAVAAAPMFVNGPELQEVYSWQTANSAWPAQPNTISVRFTPTVDLVPRVGKRLAIIIGGLDGVAGLLHGRTAASGFDATKFSSCEIHLDTCSQSGDSHNKQGMWRSGAKMFELSVAMTLSRDCPVEISLSFTNSHVGQDPPDITVAVTSDFEDFDIAPVVTIPFPEHKGTDREALFIKPSASFITKNIGQSTSAPGATNTISVTFKPQFTLMGAKNAAITLSGLKGSATPDKPIKLLNADATFNSVASWDSRSGTLVLKVAPGQEVSKDEDTTIFFDLINPKYPQSGPAVVEISANGDVPILPAAMVMPSDPLLHILKVKGSRFTTSTIHSSSKAPGAWNTITVTFQPSILLSKTRNSIITIAGLSGSVTEDTTSKMIFRSAATFMSPAGSSFTLGFSPLCKFTENKIVFDVDLDEDEDPTGTMLVFTDGGCKDRWTEIADYDRITRCATLEVKDDEKWSDGSAKCPLLGTIKALHILAGGEGYKNDAFVVESPVCGAGLRGKCAVDEYGVVHSISIDSPGYGYGPDTKIKCPRACSSTNPCSALTVQAEAEVGYTIVHDSGALSAAEWHRGGSTLKLAVRDELSTTAATTISFKIKNSMIAQPMQSVFIMASGASPIGSQQMSGDAMEIASTSSIL